jgi:hypothetical protein
MIFGDVNPVISLYICLHLFSIEKEYLLSTSPATTIALFVPRHSIATLALLSTSKKLSNKPSLI